MHTRHAARRVLTTHSKFSMKKYSLLSLSLLLFSVTMPAHAAFFMTEDELTVVIPLNDDTYAAGGMVSMQETVDGDLYLAGGEVAMKANVDEDLTLVGGDITVGETVGDDARIAGGKIIITSDVGDDLIVLGGEVTVSESSTIGGDVYVLGGDIVLDGTIEGDLYVRAGSVKVSGTIGGNVDIRADSLRFSAEVGGNSILSSKDLHISNTAQFQQDVHYWQPQGQYYFAGASVQGKAEYDESLSFQAMDDLKKGAAQVFAAGVMAIAGYALLSASLVILLLILLTKTYFTDAAKRLQRAPGVSFWYGLLYIIVTPFIAFFFLLSVIGIPIALFIGVLYVFSMVFARAFTAILLTKWLQIHYDKKWNTGIFYVLSVGMYLLIRIVDLIPFIGHLLSLIVTLMMFGSVGYTEYQKFKKVR